MKWLVGPLAVTGCVFALGCGAEEGSCEGLVWQYVRVLARKSAAPPGQIQKAEEVFRALPSRVPIMERFEWGRIEDDDTQGDRDTHILLLTFKDRQFRQDQAYKDAMDEAFGLGVIGARWEYLAHDATPHARTATRGHLRRVVSFWLKKGISPGQIQEVEDAMIALPSKVPAIERLEWGTDIDSPTRYLLLLTFENASGRDACLSHPAYEEFQRVLEQYVSGKPFEREYVVRRD